MQFIKSRLNKDNFWNLVFWLGMVLGICFTFWVNEIHKNLGTIAIWSTIIGIPFIVCKGSKVKVLVLDSKNKKLVDRNGIPLDNRLPYKFGLVVAGTVGITAYLSFMFDSFKVNDAIAYTVILNAIFLIPTLYFICINCPIAVLLKGHTWTIIDKTMNYNNSSYQFSNSSSSSISKNNSNPITDLS